MSFLWQNFTSVGLILIVASILATNSHKYAQVYEREA